ncbi:7115_t:CDS:2, partial [Racocetra persica]
MLEKTLNIPLKEYANTSWKENYTKKIKKLEEYEENKNFLQLTSFRLGDSRANDELEKLFSEDKDTENFYHGERVLKFQELSRSDKQEARRKKIGDKGQHSIRLGDKDLHPIHPGEILREELLKTYQITPQQLAQSIKVEENIVKEIVAEKRDITPEISYRL